MTLIEELAGWAAGLALEDVPARVVAYARSQLLSQLAAARAARGHPLGAALERAFGPPLADDPKQAACTLAALTMCLDFDDSLYAGHVSHSTVGVPVAYARVLRLDGRALLAATIAANECAGRVTAAATLGPFRGQMAAHAHLVGSVAARMHAQRVPPERWVDALGIALGFPPWPLKPAFFGSDAKALAAAVPVRAGLDACDAAAAGLAGARDVLEHRDGFLRRFAEVPLREAITDGLGERWHTETLSFKLYPVATGAYAAVDCGVALHPRLGGADPSAIEDVVVHSSLFTLASEEAAAPYAPGPGAPVATIGYSLRYPVATALITGGFTPADLAPPATADAARWRLAAKVRVEPDADLTRRAAVAEVPLGEALRLAGDAAGGWLTHTGVPDPDPIVRALGRRRASFERAEKAIGARLAVRLAGGRELSAEREVPLGWAGTDTRAHHPQLMREKFLRSGGAADVADGLATVERTSAGELASLLERALA
jgi:2-methylcitrate dehydratase PrpD